MRRLIGSIAALFVIACASATGTVPTSDRVIATSETNTIRATDRTAQQTVHVNARPDSVFAVLPVVYSQLGVNIKLSDPSTGEIGNRDFNKYYRLGGVTLDQYVGCGMTSTGPGANSYRVTMSLVSLVTRDATGSTVTTRLDAHAEDPSSSKGRISCLTTGALEERVNQMLIKAVGG
jgi:hypothetical protein